MPANANTTAAYNTMTKAVTTATTLGATIPQTVRDELDAIDAYATTIRDFAATLDADPAVAVLAALDAGRDPLTDPDVQRAVVARTLKQTAGTITASTENRRQRFIDDHGAAILVSLAEPFDTAAATLADAYEVLGDIDLTDDDAVVRRGGDAGRAWAEARLAEETIATIVTTWRKLGAVSRSVPQLDDRAPLLAIADVPPGEYLDTAPQTRHDPHPGPWDAVRRGWPLDLATPAEYRERLAAVRAERAQRMKPDAAKPAARSA